MSDVASLKFNQLNLLKYWRNSLADEDMMGLKDTDGQSCWLPHEQLEAGTIPEYIVEPLFSKRDLSRQRAAERKRSKSGGIFVTKVAPLKYLDIVVAPIIIQTIYEHAVKKRRGGSTEPQIICPLLFSARLNREGNILPPEKFSYPWIDRNLLTPNSQDHLILGSVEAVDKFLQQQGGRLGADHKNWLWKDLWDFAFEMLDTVSASGWEGMLREANCSRQANGMLVVRLDSRGITRSVLKAYDYLELKAKQRKRLPILVSTLTDSNSQPKEPLLDNKAIFDLSYHHCAYMTDKHSLSVSQRRVLAHFFTLREGGILAVDGPPGTGKTTLLQSIIMSLWVEKAIIGGPPPLILTSSTSNQAITNVIECMQSNDRKNSVRDGNNRGREAENITLEQRWLPGLNTFGLYLVSASKAEEANKNELEYLFSPSSGYGYTYQGSVRRFCEEEYYREAKIEFIKNANNYFHETFSDVKTIKKYLHKQLIDIHELYQRGLNCAQAAYQSIYQNNDAFQDAVHQQDEYAQKYEILDEKIIDIKSIKSAWLEFKNKELFWLQLPLIRILFKQQRYARMDIFLDKYPRLNIHGKISERNISKTISHMLRALNSQKNMIVENMEKIEDILQQRKKTEKDWQAWCREAGVREIVLDDLYELNENKNNFVNVLDTTLRYKMFLYAMHYWEARWLIEIEKSYTYYEKDYSKHGRTKYWQQYAMLMPCFITTLYTGVSLFTYYQAQGHFPYLEDIFDLLLIDEAGQVNPALIGATAMLAKRAVFIGDILQLSPVSLLTESVDRGNVHACKLITQDEDYQALRTLGYLVSQGGGIAGSTMRIAQNKCQYWQASASKTNVSEVVDEPHHRLMLIEHWRCVPDVINYCNDMFYEGCLQVKREPNKNYRWPSMGYAHIKGECESEKSSCKNVVEAKVIAEWLRQNQDKLTEDYPGKVLSEIIAIITPFRAQSIQIRKYLYEAEVEIKTVGTIHLLQGAERPIVIFSSVYTKDDDKGGWNYFFDSNREMLNVAVSRAQDAFWVFGDMDIFDPGETRKPSGVLARHLFRSPDNEITNLPLVKRVEIITEIPPGLINSRQAHRDIIKASFEQAKNYLRIISPYISIHALKLNSIAQLMEQINKNVTVIVYTDIFLNKKGRGYSPAKSMQDLRPNAIKAIRHLKEINVIVKFTCNVHSKIICIDDHTFIEGSYNWLSAVCDGSAYANHETSLLYRGSRVREFIVKVMDSIEAHGTTIPWGSDISPDISEKEVA